ncbi:hypothetical protein EU805_04425 [Salipiger sp. IMCC34102]|uniref:hypothetical protein n=1 Tax=Salipiger sp. IMCC34102 TaxID=2510647 RepID=UPI00101DF5FF|nr:hypothetical protein [Salipiger sp. IMCC34102]RYH02990.1 hypothetical protein EU805_04425 [Salipiger sp. IMCC34102]
MMSRAAALAALIALPLPALAADADGDFGVDGIGRASCEELTTAIAADETDKINAFGSWTSGFISATNALSEQTFDVTPWQSEALTLNLLNTFCGQNPETLFVNAVGRLIQTFAPARLTESSQVQVLGEGEDSVRIYVTVLDGVRRALTEAGYEVAEGPDGLTQALTAFQTDEGIETTGLPDQQTLLELFLR